MKRFNTILGFILFGLVFNLSLASAQIKVEKTIEDNFTVKEGYLLDVYSKFSDIELSTSENNEVNITAEIWVEGKKDKAQDLLDKLDVELKQSGNTVSIKTILPDKMNTGKDLKFEIKLNIQAPAYSNVQMAAKYSNVYIGEVDGHAVLDLDYSNFIIGSLSRGNTSPLNEINLAYSDGNCENLDWVKMDIAYSKLEVEEAKNLVLNSKYSEIVMEECNTFVVNSKYDKFKMEELFSFNGIFKYSGVKLGMVESMFEVEGAYTNYSIGMMGADFKAIKIENSYGNAKINMNKNASFTITSEASYGSVSVPGLNKTIDKEDGSDNYLEGTYGDSPKSKIDIDIRHSNVKFSFE